MAIEPIFVAIELTQAEFTRPILPVGVAPDYSERSLSRMLGQLVERKGGATLPGIAREQPVDVIVLAGRNGTRG